MNETIKDCEEDCLFFGSLSAEHQSFYASVRQSILEGKELPDSLNMLCGSCVAKKIIRSALEEKKVGLFGNV